jgi:phosphate transport system substrate-binding protein
VARQGRCTNFGNCETADTKKIVSVPDGVDFDCTECRRPLTSIKPPPQPRRGALVLIALLFVAVILGAVAWVRYRSSVTSVKPVPIAVAVASPSKSALPSATASPSAIALASATVPQAATPPPAEVILRLHGSITIGETLLPALVEAFLKQQGVTGIEKFVGEEVGATRIQGTFAGVSQKVIEIVPENTGGALSDLATKKCDIALASRQINAEEIDRLRQAGCGDMTSAACEHIIALDALAIIVQPSNPISELSKDQLARIFTGQITEWAQVNGSAAGKIAVFAPPETSDSSEAFRSLVLGGTIGTENTHGIHNSVEVADDVCKSTGAIGYIELPSIGSAKAVAVSSGAAPPLLPNHFEIATEDYSLSQRLFLYTAINPQNAWISKLVDFALSKAGQEVVEKTGFVSLRPHTGKAIIPVDAPDDYRRLAKDAERIDLNFRFRTASSQLDNKAIIDVDRIADLLNKPLNRGRYILLFGFADSTGTSGLNLSLSKARAETVAQQLRQLRISPALVTGFGQELPVDSNDTVEGREKNRRVEVWLRN